MTVTDAIVPAPPTHDAGPGTSRGSVAPPVDSTIDTTPVATRSAHAGALPGEDQESQDGRDWDELERSLLRMEFEAIVAAAYPAVIERPRPVPPPRRVGTVVSSARVGDRLVSTGGRQLGRPWPGAAAGIGPRERSPPKGPGSESI